jgi:hypothetical protein
LAGVEIAAHVRRFHGPELLGIATVMLARRYA